MPTLKVDGIEVTVPDGSTVLQACEEAGSEVPRFCYHDRLSIAGNCRMCLVEMEKAPKPIASCAMPAAEGMEIHTDTPTVKKAREGVMEFLLINHPLDCPICDQGGECDLQDQAVAYGRHSSRFGEGKRAVKDKDIGPLVQTIMTRCIHCTRCIRFTEEIAGTNELGSVFRGEHTEIGTYVEKAVSSELSGNLIDLCPVGALTSKPYSFTARPWELKKTETIDAMDAVGSNIRVDSRGREIMRVLPRLHEDINEEWISDKTRFACDGLKQRRLDKCWVRTDGKLAEASWDEAFAAIASGLKGVDGKSIAAIAGDMVECESLYATKALMTALGSPHIDCRQDGAALSADHRAGYIFNSGIAGIEDADAILLVGTTPRAEAPLVNARIRKRWLDGGLPIGVIGPQADLTYDYEYLGAGPQTLDDIAKRNHPFSDILKNAERPMLIIGQGALARPDGAAVLDTARRIVEANGMNGDTWNGFNVLHTAAARVGALDLGFVPGEQGRDVDGILSGSESGDIKVVFLMGADELDAGRLDKSFVIYQGHHGDVGARAADVILPGSAYTEKAGTWVNTEGRVQRAEAATQPPGDAREDWTILRALSEVLGHTLPFDTFGELQTAMIDACPILGIIDEQTAGAWGAFGIEDKLGTDVFESAVENFYMTDAISRASATMIECTSVFAGKKSGKTGTDG